MQKFGLVGMPNSGKTALFNALTGSGALAAPFPFATKEANLGVAGVPDVRLDKLAEMSRSAKLTPAQVHFCDIGGLVEGASQGEGLGNRLLSDIREAEAIVYVLAAFETEDLPLLHEPLEQLHILELELCLADLDSTQRQLERRQKQAKSDPSIRAEVALLERATELLSSGTPIYRSDLEESDKTELAANFLLTNKPVLVVANLGEDSLDSAVVQELRADLPQSEVVSMCVKLEEEVAQFPKEDQAEMFEEFGLGQGALAEFAQASQRLLKLHTFFTTGEKESRAWTFTAGSTARECAGAVHTDFAKGFIRAETIFWEDLLAIGSWNEAKVEGKIRAEGRDYLTKDGDVMEFRFTAPR